MYSIKIKRQYACIECHGKFLNLSDFHFTKEKVLIPNHIQIPRILQYWKDSAYSM